MGDRALVVFTDDDNHYTPAIYSHWGGGDMPRRIKAAQGVLRRGDATYAAARFCAVLCAAAPGVRGVGLVAGPCAGAGQEDLAALSHGDAGVFVVNVVTGHVGAFGGYGRPFDLDPSKFARL